MYSDCICLNIMVRLKKAVWEGSRRFYGCCQRLFGSCQWRNQAGRPGVRGLQGLQAGLRGGLLRWELLPSEDRFFWTPPYQEFLDASLIGKGSDIYHEILDFP